MPDPVKALMLLLLADADVAALVGSRVFGGELPEAEAVSMPRSCLVVREAGGGLLGTGWQQYTDVRFDVFAYGATPRDASILWRAVHRRMKTFARARYGSTLLHWAKPDAGPLPLRDPDTEAPYVFTSWQVLLAEVAAA